MRIIPLGYTDPDAHISQRIWIGKMHTQLVAILRMSENESQETCSLEDTPTTPADEALAQGSLAENWKLVYESQRALEKLIGPWEDIHQAAMDHARLCRAFDNKWPGLLGEIERADATAKSDDDRIRLWACYGPVVTARVEKTNPPS